MVEVAWAGNISAQALLAWRAHGWPRLRLWLAASVASAAILRLFSPRSSTYLQAYALSEPVLLGLLLAAVLELLRIRATRWPLGVGRAGDWLAAASLLVATLAALAIEQPAGWAAAPATLWRIRQIVIFGLAAGAALSWLAFGIWRATEASAAARRQHMLLTAYVALQCAAMLGYRWRIAAVNVASLAIGAALFLAWAAVIRPPAGGSRPAPAPGAALFEAHAAGLRVGWQESARALWRRLS